MFFCKYLFSTALVCASTQLKTRQEDKETRTPRHTAWQTHGRSHVPATCGLGSDGYGRRDKLTQV